MHQNNQPENRKLGDKYSDRHPDDLEAVRQALAGGLSGTSPTVEAYGRDLAAYFGARHAVPVSSGAAAISVALYAVGVQVGDEVLAPPTCPICTVNPITAAGAQAVFVDVNADHFGADVDDARRARSARTRALIDVPMWGYATPVDRLRDFTREAGMALILDLAHAHGSKLHGRHLSAYADIACFSTHDRKPLSTGEGGFLLTDDDGLAERCRTYSRFGNLNGRDFGLNYKLGALPAALGASRLKRLDAQLARRKANARRLVDQITHPGVGEAVIVEGGEANYYFLNLRLRTGDNRKFIEYLEEHGVPSDILRYGCRCLYEFPLLAEYRRECPRAAALLSGMTTVPVHPDLNDDDMDYVAKLINGYPG